jgi:predicted RNA methylase
MDPPAPSRDLAVLAAHGALGPTVVDLGTGTGRFAMAAAARCERVVAVDVSRAMLAHVRASAPSTVEAVRAGFLSYEHAGAPADAVHSRDAVH